MFVTNALRVQTQDDNNNNNSHKLLNNDCYLEQWKISEQLEGHEKAGTSCLESGTGGTVSLQKGREQ